MPEPIGNVVDGGECSHLEEADNHHFAAGGNGDSDDLNHGIHI